MSNIEILSTANDWINEGHKVAIATVLRHGVLHQEELVLN